jgi:hypothetical protein
MLSGCSSKLFTKTVYVVPELPNTIFTSCEKPTTVLSDLKVSNTNEIKNLDDEDVNLRIIEAYSKGKVSHIGCYKTLVNVKNTYSNMKIEIETKNK